MSRTIALLAKELDDLRHNPGVFGPALLTGAIALALPFVVAILIPYLAGEPLSGASEVEMARDVFGDQPGAAALDDEAAVQAWILQQFLLLLAIAPVAASMSVAAYSVVGEKQARTLEPLLATPITTLELLAAKVLASLIPALIMAVVMFGVYIVGAVALARPGVAGMLLQLPSLAIMFVLAPLSALAALELAVLASSRATDARSAQQISALIVLPLSALLVAQLLGNLVLTYQAMLVMAAGLVLLDAALLWMAVRLFDRESILTRWT